MARICRTTCTTDTESRREPRRRSSSERQTHFGRLSDGCMSTFKYPRPHAAPRQHLSGWDHRMKSIVSEALARHEEARVKEEAAPQKPHVSSEEDDEIQKIVDSLNVSIKIIGCGGGGADPIHRGRGAGGSGGGR